MLATSAALGERELKEGPFTSVLIAPPDCTSPVGICTLGTLTGDFHGTYYFVMDTLVPANDGFATLFRRQADQAMGVDGSIASRSDGLRDSISRNEKRQAELENRVTQTEARLRKQYTALDTQMGQLQSLSSYVTQQMAMLNNSKS
jgi:hypothetical protein